ncbi:ectonucleoside triphosphate diphosphohydrolase 3 isoform X5 [Callorhinchus milii]|uniref:ectonucleoside triphosphate diphosphohydrolase 3 isoform X5 n=1 Tax=Callorhinchus milii TaxID=7868 RepID=UPI001C3FC902|nr:ectonucleoside triphosphate diphosphohydrolase 3 isoform X5 [Callorhinchus milii]
MVAKKLIIAISVMFCSLLIIISVSIAFATKKKILSSGLKYGIILDAGSSRTTAFVYQWPAEKKHNTGLVTEKYHCRIEGPGIATYKENPKQAAIAILDCLNRTLKIIPKERYSTTQVCLAATAGMRLLELQDKPAAQRILSEIEALFKTLPFNFGRVHILTGREEAIYAWISANYLKGNLVKAFSAFYYTKRALKLPTSFTLTTFTETLWSFCTKSWAELKVMLPKDKDRYRKGYCFSGNYMRTLLISGYKFKPASWKRISFNKKVDGNEVNWSLGYMLNVTNQIPREIKGKENMIKLAILSKVLIVFSSLLMFSIFIIYQMIKHP